MSIYIYKIGTIVADFDVEIVSTNVSKRHNVLWNSTLL